MLMAGGVVGHFRLVMETIGDQALEWVTDMATLIMDMDMVATVMDIQATTVEDIMNQEAIQDIQEDVLPEILPSLRLVSVW